MLLKLPPELLPSCLQPFLTAKEYKQVLDTTKVWTALKFQTVYFKLRAPVSKKLYDTFTCDLKTEIFRKVRDSRHQIALNLSFFQDIVSIRSDVAESVHSINLSHCRNLADISSLSTLSSVNLSKCALISSASSLRKLFSVNLSDCTSITDVSSLGDVHTLNLSGCSSIREVSALGKVRHLILDKCSGIADFSSLSKVYDLSLAHCPQLIDCSCLRENKRLNLSFCRNLQWLCPTVNLYYLNLTGCTGITDFDHFAWTSRIQVLHLSFCTQLTSVAMFVSVKKLFLLGLYEDIDTYVLMNTKVIR